ncbi:hypothetical protein PENTCL1PPCAC_19565, partial [Pristionchus entomophagus]
QEMPDILKLSNGGQRHRYKLFYFDIKGRAEPIRLIFEFFRVKFEDVRVKFEDWPALKKKAPMQFLPYLEVDGGKLVLSQAPAIMRYLAKSFRPGFAGNSKSDSALVDMYGEGSFDMFDVFRTIGMAPEEKREEALAEATPRLECFCQCYSNHLSKNGNRYIDGDLVTWADLVIVFVVSAMDDLANDILMKYPDLCRYYLRMRDIDELRDYIEANWKHTTIVVKDR